MELFAGAGQIISVVTTAVVLALVLIWVLSRIRVAKPSEAIIISGANRRATKKPTGSREPKLDDDGNQEHDGDGRPLFLEEGTPTGAQKVVIGGRAFVLPIVQRSQRVSLKQYQTEFTVSAPDKNYITMSINGIVHFKVTGDVDGVRRAAERFPQVFEGNTPNDAAVIFQNIIKSSVQGHVRSIIGERTFEEISSDRKSFMEAVIQVVSSDLRNQGVTVEVLNIDEINTPGSDYLKNLSRSQQAGVQRDAELKEIETNRQINLQKIEADQLVADRQKEFALRQAEIQSETDSAQARAAAAGPLAKAQQDREIAVLEADAFAEKAKVTEKQLDIDVRKPAEAEAYAAVQQANADRDARKASAEAEAFERTTIANANKEAAVKDAEASATAIRLDGEARASAIEAEGAARASSTKAQAEALESNGQNVLAQQAIAQMPEIAAALATGIANVGNISIISNDGDGVGSFTESFASTATKIPELLKATTGLDLPSILSGLVGGSVAAKAQPHASAVDVIGAADPKRVAKDAAAAVSVPSTPAVAKSPAKRTAAARVTSASDAVAEAAQNVSEAAQVTRDGVKDFLS